VNALTLNEREIIDGRYFWSFSAANVVPFLENLPLLIMLPFRIPDLLMVSGVGFGSDEDAHSYIHIGKMADNYMTLKFRSNGR
jgi:hypothetical protein